jgi:hypothetical protein
MEPDLADLLAAWLGIETSPERLEALLARLRIDEAFRRSFVDEIRMLGMLKTVQSPESRWLRLEDELGWSSSESASAEPLEDRIVRGLDGQARRQFRPSIALIRRGVVAAALLLAVGLGLAFWPKGPVVVPEPPGVSEIRPYPRVDSSVGLAMVVKLDGAFWESSTAEPRPKEGDILAAGRFRLASGRVILSMLTGVVLDVEGPADVELISDNKVLCHQGRIRARVPSGAEGFLVLGPSSAVVDLGTEFALNVGLDGKTQGRVFLGKLEAAVLNAAGSPRRSYLLDANKANSSKAFEIDAKAGKIEAVATSEDFVSASDPIAPPMILDARYSSLVLSSNPWGYWRFESLADGSTPNEVPGRPPLKAAGPLRLVGQGDTARPGPGNRSVEFLAAKEPQFLTLADDWRPNSNPGYAVEFWCLSRSIAHASLASLVSPRETDHHVFLMELTSRNRLTIHKPASIRLLHRWPPGWEGGDNTYSSEPYVPHRWHHFVGQVVGDRIELYKDGEVSSQASATLDRSEAPCQLILGRLTALSGTGLSVDRPFVGQMDEVALYDHPLTIEEIRNHYRLGTGSRSGK